MESPIPMAMIFSIVLPKSQSCGLRIRITLVSSALIENGSQVMMSTIGIIIATIDNHFVVVAVVVVGVLPASDYQ